MSSWTILIIAGFLEVVWAIGLKYTEGFSKPIPSALTISAIIGSMYLLAKATQSIPLGTAYGIWVGIGAIGSAVAGVVLFGEAVSVSRILCFVLLLAGVIGLKLTNT